MVARYIGVAHLMKEFSFVAEQSSEYSSYEEALEWIEAFEDHPDFDFGKIEVRYRKTTNKER